MKDAAKFFKLFADETRLRVFMLLSERELCVCQLMGILGVSQPLVSRNIALLDAAGLLDERRDGKLMFYALKKKLPTKAMSVLAILRKEFGDNQVRATDLETLGDCLEYQKKEGRCNMETFLKFMEKQRKKRLKEAS